MLIHGALTQKIIWCFYEVYKQLGFGFLEAVYSNAMSVKLRQLGLEVDREKLIEVVFEGVQVGHYRADLIVDGLVLVEIKSSRSLVEADDRQLQNYLKATSIEVGLLLHFGPKPAHKRFVFTNARK